MGHSLEKQKEGFPRDRRFQQLPEGSPHPVIRQELREPWASFVRVYCYFFENDRLPFLQALAEGAGNVTDWVLDSSYRILMLITLALHCSVLIYGAAYWFTELRGRPPAWSQWVEYDGRGWFSDEVTSDNTGVFSYYGAAWHDEYALVERILTKATQRRLTNRETQTLTETIVSEAREHHVDPAFVATIIKYESGFRRAVVSSAGAVGLMQLLPATGRFVCAIQRTPWGGVKRLCNPAYNLRLGIHYLKHLHHQFPHNLSHVLIAYNWGPGNLQRALAKRRALPKGPVRYARSILRDYEAARQVEGTFQTIPVRTFERSEGKLVF